MDDSVDDTPGLDLDTVVEILEQAPVRRGILFGSYAKSDDHAGSDVDIAVEFDEDLSSVERTRARLAITEKVSVALGIDAVDVVPLSTAPAGLRRDIVRDGIVLVGQRPTPAEHETAASEDTRERFDALIEEMEQVV